MRHSSLLEFVTGYEKSEREFSSSKISRLERKFTDNVISGFGANHAKKIIANPVVRFFSGCARSLAYASLRAIGSCLLTFSLLTLILNLFSYYLVDSITVIPASPLIAAGVAGVISVPLLLFDTPFTEAIQAFRPIDVLLFDVLCLKRTTAKRSDTKPAGTSVMIFIGILAAVYCFLIPMHVAFISMAAALFVVLSFSSPEFSFMMTLLMLPFIQIMPGTTVILAVGASIASLSFALKVMMGKRTFHFEQYDLILFMMMLFVLASGIFNGGLDSFRDAVVTLALTLAYPLASNLIINRRLADNAVNLILFSSLPTAIYAILAYFTESVRPEWIDPAFAGSISSRAYATFGNPNIYAVFLIVTVVFSFVLMLDKINTAGRIYYITVFALNLFAMVLTWTRGAWLALVLSLAAAAVIGRIKIKSLLIPIAAVPVIVTLFGGEIVERLFSAFNLADTSISSRLSIWRSSLAMLKERPLLGYGMGTESFISGFLPFAEDGVTAPHSHNLFLEIAIEAGGFALLLFCILLLVRIRHIATYAPYIKGSTVSPIFTASAVAIFALLTFGMTDYIFYNKSMYFLFFAVFGITGSALRIARQDHMEARLGLGSESSVYSAEVDISIIR